MNNSGLVFANALCLGCNIGMSLLNFVRGNIALGVACVFVGVVNISVLYILLED